MARILLFSNILCKRESSILKKNVSLKVCEARKILDLRYTKTSGKGIVAEDTLTTVSTRN